LQYQIGTLTFINIAGTIIKIVSLKFRKV